MPPAFDMRSDMNVLEPLVHGLHMESEAAELTCTCLPLRHIPS
ncbi:hypothetical protein MMALV_03390 [Candidatus Methanomethylophilus alvi Mx1201]|uniref:Uncharacterized protein n=1 Tax=Methanomethylophilus alvi (strain Mx1201) TaxID=1236689 RepID=M9S9P6_METAX|nr:hypothetical protein MMALV_03390 [Candidatus Methanomethylophilus alvi Mx1201]